MPSCPRGNSAAGRRHDEQAGQGDAATITGLLDRLTSAGLVERRPHPTDRRINPVYLTSTGRALQRDLDREIDALAAGVLGRFPRADADRFRAILVQMGGVEERRMS